MTRTPPILLAACLMLASLAGAGENREETLDRYVKEIIPRGALLTAFLREMPKGADLNVNARGSVYAETMVANAMESDPPVLFDLDARRFAPAGDVPENALDADDIRNGIDNLGKVLDALGCRNLDLYDESGHDHFFSAFPRMGAAAPLPAAGATEIFTRAAAQKIHHLELAIHPEPPPRGAYADPGAWDEARRLGRDDARRWKLAYSDPAKRGEAFARSARSTIDVYEKARKDRLAELGMDNDDLMAGYILCLDRSLDPSAFEEALLDLVAAWNLGDDRLVGFTLAGPEDAWRSRANFRKQFKIIDRYARDDANWHGGARPKFKWQAGELTLAYSPYEAMRDRIGETIWMGHANRIGHGLSIAWEDNAYELLSDMRTKCVCVEVCPSVNDAVLGVAGDDHSYHLYRAAGVPMVIATGGEGVARSNLTNEYVKAARDFNLGYKELKRLSRNSLEYSFLPGDSLFENHDYAKPKARPPAGSRKAEAQLRLERDFVEFERYMVDKVLKTILVHGETPP